MTPDSYLKFVPGDFATATLGRSPQVKWAYWICLVHYRCHNHCHGLENNENHLRRLCEVETDKDWKEAKDFIFDNDKCFTLDEHGLWQQKRAQIDYEEDKQKLIRHVLHSQRMNEARWNKKKKKK